MAEVDSDLTRLAGRVTELDKGAAVQQRAIDGLEQAQKAATDAQDQTADRFEEYRRLSDARFAVLEHQMADLRADRDRWAARFWGLLVVVVGGILLAAILAALGLRKP